MWLRVQFPDFQRGPVPQLRTVSQSLGSCQALRGDGAVSWNQLLFCPSSQPFSGDTHTLTGAPADACMQGKQLKEPAR